MHIEKLRCKIKYTDSKIIGTAQRSNVVHYMRYSSEFKSLFRIYNLNYAFHVLSTNTSSIYFYFNIKDSDEYSKLRVSDHLVNPYDFNPEELTSNMWKRTLIKKLYKLYKKKYNQVTIPIKKLIAYNKLQYA